MSDYPNPPNEPDWLTEFEDMANDQLGEGSACEQVHPIIESWYTRLLQGEPPASRDSVIQAMSCLATEILYASPEEILSAVMEHVSEEELAAFIEYVLLRSEGHTSELQSREKLDCRFLLVKN